MNIYHCLGVGATKKIKYDLSFPRTCNLVKPMYHVSNNIHTSYIICVYVCVCVCNYKHNYRILYMGIMKNCALLLLL